MFYSSVIEGIDGERMSFGLRLWLPEGNQHFWNIVCSIFNTFLFYALFTFVFLVVLNYFLLRLCARPDITALVDWA